MKILNLCKTFFGEKSLGSITINLNNLIDQDEMEKLFDLNPGNGKIRMKLKCILNLVNHYDKEIKKKENDLHYFTDLYGRMQAYEEQMQISFAFFKKNIYLVTLSLNSACGVFVGSCGTISCGAWTL